MSFIEEELRNYTNKALQGVLGTGNRNTAPDNLTSYEEPTKSGLTITPDQIATEFNSIPPAPNVTEARANAVLEPTIIGDYSLPINAIHCTPSPNNKAFYATTTYGDMGSRMYNWIMPQMVPRTDGAFEGMASIGYAVRLYQGDPNAGGTEIGTTTEQVGAITGWTFQYGVGAIVVASSFSAISNPNDIWITGFQYIGTTGAGSSVESTVVGNTRTFINSDLVGGVLTFVHGLDAQDNILHVTIKNQIDNIINPDNITYGFQQVFVNFGMIIPIDGEWTILVTCIVDETVVEEIEEQNEINENEINENEIG